MPTLYYANTYSPYAQLDKSAPQPDKGHHSRNSLSSTVRCLGDIRGFRSPLPSILRFRIIKTSLQDGSQLVKRELWPVPHTKEQVLFSPGVAEAGTWPLPISQPPRPGRSLWLGTMTATVALKNAPLRTQEQCTCTEGAAAIWITHRQKSFGFGGTSLQRRPNQSWAVDHPVC